MHYNIDLHTLTVPSSIMTFPYYIPGGPLWFTLAGFGWHVAHSMFHIFDSNSQHSLLASYRGHQPWETTTRNLAEVGACIPHRLAEIMI